MRQHEPAIGVFDSGVGGLTVLRAVVDLLPGEHTVYLGDTARLPYGSKSAAVVTRYALNVVELLTRSPLKALVVACNTASAVALPALHERFGLPTLGVIAPGARAALDGSHPAQRVAVLATEGTIRSGAYDRALHEIRAEVEVRDQACPLFVPLAEEGLCEGPIVELVCQRYLDSLRGQVDTAILGCTHYPLLKQTIAHSLGPEVRVVDSAHATALELRTLLDDRGLRREGGDGTTHRFLFTDQNPRTDEMCARFFGQKVDAIEVVDL
ncbi:MAG: glutamate racemase [Pseudomonadota bacterium]